MSFKSRVRIVCKVLLFCKHVICNCLIHNLKHIYVRNCIVICNRNFLSGSISITSNCVHCNYSTVWICKHCTAYDGFKTSLTQNIAIIIYCKLNKKKVRCSAADFYNILIVTDDSHKRTCSAESRIIKRNFVSITWRILCLERAVKLIGIAVCKISRTSSFCYRTSDCCNLNTFTCTDFCKHLFHSGIIACTYDCFLYHCMIV